MEADRERKAHNSNTPNDALPWRRIGQRVLWPVAAIFACSQDIPWVTGKDEPLEFCVDMEPDLG